MFKVTNKGRKVKNMPEEGKNFMAYKLECGLEILLPRKEGAAASPTYPYSFTYGKSPNIHLAHGFIFQRLDYEHNSSNGNTTYTTSSYKWLKKESSDPFPQSLLFEIQAEFLERKPNRIKINYKGMPGNLEILYGIIEAGRKMNSNELCFTYRFFKHTDKTREGHIMLQFNNNGILNDYSIIAGNTSLLGWPGSPYQIGSYDIEKFSKSGKPVEIGDIILVSEVCSASITARKLNNKAVLEDILNLIKKDALSEKEYDSLINLSFLRFLRSE